MKKIMPKKKIYATSTVFELEISYSFKGQHFKNTYLFDSQSDTELFAKEALMTFLNKNFQNIHISLYRKEKYSDTRINTDEVKATVQGAKKDRQKRIEELNSF